ncbi:PREDICTED: general transcription factor 3C polypeptide 2 [Pygoscelis adeliae]|uniref:general transcription factor 3C polypeptide 2 n=1 Tax=Pygoscelis adeliae TaxID=9238 RepID=UPI0004F50041|nr:PREDICTED: general transcription factor 3C polypeptide 2 [Pygoscelis adeliae]
MCRAERSTAKTAVPKELAESGRYERNEEGKDQGGNSKRMKSLRKAASQATVKTRELLPLGDLDALGHSEEAVEATKSQSKTAQNQKTKSSPSDTSGQAPAETEAHGEPSRTSENGSVPPPKAPGKRGRKPKTEMLLLKLSQDLECPTPEPICVQKMLGSSGAAEGLETPPSGRPKRRAAKVALLYLQELAEELTSVYQPPAPTEGAQEPESELEHIQKKRRSRRRKEEETDSDDPARDADFVPSKEVLLQAEEEEGSDAPLSEVSEPEMEALRGHGVKMSSAGAGPGSGAAADVWRIRCRRDQKYSQWEFPDWIPLAHKWTCLSESEAAPYLPTEEKSPLFSIQREGIEDDGVLYRVNRFNPLQPHEERLDVSFFGDGSFHKYVIYKVQCIAVLQVGSIQAGNASECGQCFSLSWMPSKPHHHLAAGFYDGTVAVWNLLTKSLLQCVRQPDGSLKLYPFRCFLAHDHAVRSIEWCKADSNFLVTAGSDRKIKFWDLRRLYEPINSIKRFLSTEVAWLLPYNGVTVAQDNCYASYGLCGIHYIDAGYLGFKAYFVAPRKGTVWGRPPSPVPSWLLVLLLLSNKFIDGCGLCHRPLDSLHKETDRRTLHGCNRHGLTTVGMGQAEAWQDPALAWARRQGARLGKPVLRAEL